MMLVKCKDCGVEISADATHTGHEKWCEDCFDKGLHKDMDDHFNNFVKNEILEITTDKEFSVNNQTIEMVDISQIRANAEQIQSRIVSLKEVKASKANHEFMRRMAGKGGFRPRKARKK